MKQYLYDVYTDDGSKIMSEVTSREIADCFGIRLTIIATYAKEDKPYRGKYWFVRVVKNSSDETLTYLPQSLLKEWDKVRNLFQNVIWVKNYSPGVKVLHFRDYY